LRAIVTGSEGFIGKALCRRLAPQFDVIRIDTKIGGDAARIEPLLANGGIDVVFHLAAETSVFNDRLDDIERENVHAFMVVATACRRYGVKLVYASSSTANACNTTSMYGMTKHFNEQFAKAYCPRATGVRLHNVYGPDPRKGTLLFNLLNEESCTIYNDGRNVRHFTFIGDAVEALIYAYTCNRQLVNCVNPVGNTVREFCDEVGHFRPLKLHYTHELRPLDNFEQSVNETIFTVPLPYKNIRQGIAALFDE
jgi:UDP-glucuronate 4-epimerase